MNKKEYTVFRRILRQQQDIPTEEGEKFQIATCPIATFILYNAVVAHVPEDSGVGHKTFRIIQERVNIHKNKPPPAQEDWLEEPESSIPVVQLQRLPKRWSEDEYLAVFEKGVTQKLFNTLAATKLTWKQERFSQLMRLTAMLTDKLSHRTQEVIDRRFDALRKKAKRDASREKKQQLAATYADESSEASWEGQESSDKLSTSDSELAPEEVSNGNRSETDTSSDEPTPAPSTPDWSIEYLASLKVQNPKHTYRMLLDMGKENNPTEFRNMSVPGLAKRLQQIALEKAELASPTPSTAPTTPTNLTTPTAPTAAPSRPSTSVVAGSWFDE
ncbi:hypothetical protein DFS34DRAFT_590372 [Phlyctochytrium arcticum]|nr:hypothetical protein DFS34DRAFT_590372 [Phlyctochytrium arcticum]